MGSRRFLTNCNADAFEKNQSAIEFISKRNTGDRSSKCIAEITANMFGRLSNSIFEAVRKRLHGDFGFVILSILHKIVIMPLNCLVIFNVVIDLTLSPLVVKLLIR